MKKVVPQPIYDNEQGFHFFGVVVISPKQYGFDKFAIIVSSEVQMVKPEVNVAFLDITVLEVIKGCLKWCEINKRLPVSVNKLANRTNASTSR